MDCRGHRRRVEIVDRYNVVPVAHIQLLNGQTIHSDAEAEISNDYYIFTVSDRETSNFVDNIQCGMGAARDFLRLIGHDGLPIFNPLRGINVGGAGGDLHGINAVGAVDNDVLLARQLYNACMWIFILRHVHPGTPIFAVTEDVRTLINHPPINRGKLIQKIKAVNTIIGGLFRGQTLSEEINEIGKRNNLRDNMCQFNLIRDAIDNINAEGGNIIDSHF